MRQAICNLTNFQSRLRLGQPNAPVPDPNWVELLDMLEAADPDARADLVNAAADRSPDAAISQSSAAWPTLGAFSMEVIDTTARTHFANTDRDDLSPLHPSKLADRRKELHELVERIHRENENVHQIRGASWRYHLRSYRSLFPTAHMGTALPRRGVSIFRGMSHWGQFLDHRGSLRVDQAAIFRQNVQRWDGTSDMCELFPRSILIVESPIENFLGLGSEFPTA